MKSSVMNSEQSRAAGLKVLRDMGWPEDSGLPEMDPQFWAFTKEHLLGQVWSRPALSLRDRELVTLAILMAVDADLGQRNHLRYAYKLGITEEQMREIIIQVCYYSGWCVGAAAMARFRKVLQEPDCGWPSAQKK